MAQQLHNMILKSLKSLSTKKKTKRIFKTSKLKLLKLLLISKPIPLTSKKLLLKANLPMSKS